MMEIVTRALRRFSCAVILVCVLAPAGPLAAQKEPEGDRGILGLPVAFTARLGRAKPHGNRDCASSNYGLAGLEVRTRGALFVSAGAETVGPVGFRDACELARRPEHLADGRVLVLGDGRFNLDRGGHYTVGLGARTPPAVLAGEVAVKLGWTRGQPHVDSEWLRSLTASLGTVFGDLVVLSVEWRWFRIPQSETYYAAEDWATEPWRAVPVDAAVRWNWRALRTVAIGVRF